MQFGAHTNQIIPVVGAAHTGRLNVMDFADPPRITVAGVSYQVVVDSLVVHEKSPSGITGDLFI